MIEKIKQGLYVDLRELMPDNAALSKMLLEVRAVSVVQAESKVREIEDPMIWAFYFLALLAVSVEDPKEKEIVAYSQLIVQLSQSCSTCGDFGHPASACTGKQETCFPGWAKATNPASSSASMSK